MEVCRELSLPDSKLLQWTEQDLSSCPSEATVIGAGLSAGEKLYKNLQASYK